MQGRAAALQYVRGHIEDGSWPPHARIPTERELAETFGIARNTLRRVLDELAAEGLLARRVGSGTYVAPKSRPFGAELLASMLDTSPSDLMEVRLMVEPQATWLAATRATASDLTRIRRYLALSEQAETISDFEKWDEQLHLAIARASKNQLVVKFQRIFSEIRRQPQWIRFKQRVVSPESRIEYEKQHREIVEALARGDPELALQCIHRHLHSVTEKLRGGHRLGHPVSSA